MRKSLTIIITIIVTTIVVLLAMNFFTGEKRIEKKLEQSYQINDEQFIRSMSVLLGPPYLEGNDVKTLNNGDEIFAAMLQAIKGAEKTITFETFIYWNDSIGIEFAEALSERARAGVKVHVLLDWLGSVKMDEKQLDQLKRAGVEIQRYHEPHWSHLPRLNNRTHRKILAIDGKLGFTGGVGIADQWRGDARNPQEWRDSHYQVTGPAVAQLQAVFMDNWIKAQGRVLHGELYFPALKPTGQHKAQIFSSSPTGGSDSMQLMYMMSITAAKQSIDISSAYFVPDELTMATLISAAKRGVKIRIITPGEHIDTETVRKASKADWGKLLEAGIKIAEYKPTMYHCKIFIADNQFVSVGSTNFDNRSFRLNDEANLNIYDSVFASEQTKTFNEDWSHSHQITYQEWANRPLTDKALEELAGILKTQL